jgi:creatinine amidohydrolase
VLVSCSPLEVHGPHLPVAADNHESEALLLRMIELLSERVPGLSFLHLPPLYVAADVVPRSGSLAFRPSTIQRVLEDLGRSLARQGFSRVWVMSFHGGPRHFLPLEIAADKVSRRYGIQMVSLFGLLLRRADQRRGLPRLMQELTGLDPATLEGDFHAGAFESAMVLHLLGEHVDPSYRSLPRCTLEQKLRAADRPAMAQQGLLGVVRLALNKLRYWSEETYAGEPALATAEMGQRVVEGLGELGAEALEELLRGAIPTAEQRSVAWPYRHLFLNRPLGWLAERLARYKTEVW